MIDLGTLPGGSNSDALDINRFGEIAGLSDGVGHLQVGAIWTRHSKRAAAGHGQR